MPSIGRIRVSRLAAECSEILRNQMKDPAKGILGLATLSASAMLATTPIYAQDNADAEELVLVTGSRIVGSGMQTPTPVTAVTNVELAKMDPGNMIDALDQLPQFFNNTTATDRGNFLGPAGGAFLNVRGLGTDRTLTLLDGHRMPPSDRNSAVDTNLFPEALIQRVEVVTGGLRRRRAFRGRQLHSRHQFRRVQRQGPVGRDALRRRQELGGLVHRRRSGR